MRRKNMAAALLAAAFCITALGTVAEAASDMKSTATITFQGDNGNSGGNGGNGGNGGGGGSSDKDRGGNGSAWGENVLDPVEWGADTVIIVDPEVPLAHPDTLPETGGTRKLPVGNPFTGNKGLLPGLLCMTGALLLTATPDRKPEELAY